MKRTKLRLQGVSDASQLKREIQALLRACVILRDGGCILRRYGSCNEVLQGEHLITRSNMGTFADLRNIICLCSYHHIFFKKQYSQLYWQYVQNSIGQKRWDWLQLAQEDRSPHKVDLKLEKIALELQLKQLQEVFHVAEKAPDTQS